MLINRLNTAAAAKCRRQSRNASASASGISMPINFTADLSYAAQPGLQSLPLERRCPLDGTSPSIVPLRLLRQYRHEGNNDAAVSQSVLPGYPQRRNVPTWDGADTRASAKCRISLKLCRIRGLLNHGCNFQAAHLVWRRRGGECGKLEPTGYAICARRFLARSIHGTD